MTAVASSNYAANNRISATEFGQQQTADDQYLSTFFCRALYDYQSQDASSLSFFRGDVIEVLTQLESGWWDGLLNDERGWFPSNYVEPISDQEAEAELSRSDYTTVRSNVIDSAIDVSQNVNIQSDRAEDWLRNEMDYANSRGGLPETTNTATTPAASSDFWVPQVAPNGQIYYVNTQTGERSRELPTDVVEDTYDGDLAGLSSSSSRNGSSSGLAMGSSSARPLNGQVVGVSSSVVVRAAFGVERRSGTPEPWIKRLADDGMSYYYHNKVTNQVQWTRPEPNDNQTANPSQERVRRPTVTSTSSSSGYTSQSSTRDTLHASNRLRSDSSASQLNVANTSTKRLSVYSDDSDVQPRDLDKQVLSGSESASDPLPGRIIDRSRTKSQAIDVGEEEPFDLTSAERAAMLLQQALTPASPESIDTLSERTRDTILGVMQTVDDNGLPKGPNQEKEVEGSVNEAVVAVRNLLYISCALSGPLPNTLGERITGDPNATATAQQLQAQLKTSQRKATATLSKLVLSARAAKFQRELMSAEMMFRVEQDAADLQRSIDSFVLDVQKQYARTAVKQLHARVGRKRLRGVFGIANVGLGLPGAGLGGHWTGLGYVGLEEDVNPPRRTLSAEALNEVAAFASTVDERLSQLVDGGQASGIQTALTQLWSFVSLVTDINVASHVDVDGIRKEHEGSPPPEPSYLQAVVRARVFLRTLEVCLQALHDDGSILFLTCQALSVGAFPVPRPDGKTPLEALAIAATSARANLRQLQETLDALLTVGFDQARAAQSDYHGSIEWRMSRLSILDGGRPLSNFFGPLKENHGGEDVIDMEMAIRKQGTRAPMGPVDSSTEDSAHGQGSPQDSQTPLADDSRLVGQEGLLPHSRNASQSSFLATKPLPPTKVEDDAVTILEKSKSPPRAAKIRQLLGDDAPESYINNANADSKPWFLRANYARDEILMNPDGGIRGGTLSALIERLTTHEYGDPIFIKTFLMTYKSFTTLNELFDILVLRFNIQAPEGLKPEEFEEWTRSKQAVIRIRVLNTFKTMLTDEDVLEKDDMYILDRMKEFTLQPEVAKLNAAKHLLSLVERAKINGDAVVKMTAVTPSYPPPVIQPKMSSSRKFKFLDVDPLEMARQLTILESRYYNKIRAIECLQRAREQRVGEHNDHIGDVIQVANKIAYWVASTVLAKEDSRKRAAMVKQFISIADRCRSLNNFSSMVAITSGLNSPPIRRLKRTWEQVNGRFMAQLGACETTLDSGKNFANYRATLAKVNPPCIPFIGVYLTVLTFIQDGSKDILPGNLINFGKRQRAAEVIREIKHWQSKPFNLTPLHPVLAFIEESLGSFSDPTDWNDYFWNLSLEREPREREDEKMARLLQESGFL